MTCSSVDLSISLVFKINIPFRTESVVVDDDLLGSVSVWIGRYEPTFRGLVLSPSSGLKCCFSVIFVDVGHFCFDL